MTRDLLRAFRALSTEKEAIRKREVKLVSDLRQTLSRLGYRLEAISTNGRGQRAGAPSAPGTAVPRPGALTCAQCGRTFALPLHLGRHMSVAHKTKRAVTAPPAPARNGSQPAPANTVTSRRQPRMSRAARRAAARRTKSHRRKRKAARRATSR
jgi:hypothetical protein